jgi:hypothetical protein
MKNRLFVRRLKIAAIGLVAVTGVGFLVMSLWNWLAPTVFAGHTITFWQALGLLVLSRILVGGWRGGAGPGKHSRRRMLERWERMSPEEREKFRQGLGEGCGRRGMTAAEPDAAAG